MSSSSSLSKSKELRRIPRVVLSAISFFLPLLFTVPGDSFTQDFAVIEVDANKIDVTNFIGKDPVKTLITWMHPDLAKQRSFKPPSPVPRHPFYRDV